ncbi:MAG: hypothetical protein MRY79_01295 [Alphaproteobacteria bacterium]|nr:hypothetical protein [Alphaproteobacteria bacterium]
MAETQGKSLQQIMNEMVTRLDTVHNATSQQKKSRKGRLSELEAFISLDPVLANLNRQYLEAKAQRCELVALNGKEDAMVEVALDMEDSAWCAMETRLLELRRNGELMRRVQSMLRRSRQKENEQIEETLRAGLEKQRQKFVEWARMAARLKEKNKVPVIFEWAVLMLVFNIAPFDRPAYSGFKRRYGSL